MVDAHRALVWIVEAPDEARERRLAAARFADERKPRSGGHVDVDAVQHRLDPVCEDDVVDREIAVDARDLARVRLLPDLGLLVENGGDLHHRRRARLELAVHVRELLQRLEPQLKQIESRDQRPDRQLVPAEQRAAGVENRARGDHAEELDRREEDREDLLRVDVLLAIRRVQLVELVLEAALAVERLHDRHAGDRLRDLRRHDGDAIARLDERDVGGPLEPACQDECRRHDREDDEAEPPVCDQQGRERGRQEHDVRDEGRHALREDVRDRVHVARQPGDDPPGLLLREVAEREPRQVVEEVAAQAQHHALPEAGETADEDRLEDPAAGGDAEVDRDDDREVALVVHANSVVDRVAYEQPAARLRRSVAGCDEQEYEREELVSFEIAPEPFHAATTSSAKSSANGPPARRRSRGIPDSTIPPSTSTTARSASSTVESRCVATSTVRPARAGRSRFTSRRSVSVSPAQNRSSSTTTRASVTSARASATRCRCPPDRLIPRSPISVS